MYSEYFVILKCSFYKNNNNDAKMIEEEDDGDEQESDGTVQKYSLNNRISRYLWANSLLSAWKLAFSRQGVIPNMWWDSLASLFF